MGKESGIARRPLVDWNDKSVNAQTIALLKKECYQSAVKMVDLTSNETNFVAMHKLSTDLAQVVYDAVSKHLKIED